MIGRLAALLGPRQDLLWGFLIVSVMANMARGVAFALLVPTVQRLLLGDLAGALPWLGAFAATAALTLGLGYLAALRGFDTAIELLTTLRIRIGDHVASLPVGWFVPANTGRLRTTLSSGVMTITGVPAHRLDPLIRAAVTPLTLAVAMALIDVRLGLVVLVTLGPLVLAYRIAGRLGQRADAAVAASVADAGDRMVEFARAQPVLRTLDQSGSGRARFDDALGQQRRAERRQLLLVLPPIALNSSIARLAFLGLLAAIAALALAADGREEVVQLVASLVVVNRIVEPLSELAAHRSALRIAAAQLDAVDAILAARPLPPPRLPETTPTDATLEFRQVSFGYPQGPQVLDRVSFTVPAGTTTALVGPSGSGKTTIARLAARAWDPTGGQVLIGGVDLRDLDDAQLRLLVAPVFQDRFLVPGTLRDNVGLGRPDAAPEQLDTVARLARLTDMIARLPDGWDTPVGDGGSRLSGGERQRITIARALLKEAPVVLLDEATSALDAENQAAVIEGLQSLRGRATTLVIAHELSTIVAADHILVLDGGRIIEEGTHDALLAQGDRYATLWHTMTTVAGWRLTDPPD